MRDASSSVGRGRFYGLGIPAPVDKYPPPPPPPPRNNLKHPPLPQTPQKCVQAGCSAETACGVDVEGGDDLGTNYEVHIVALVETPGSAAASGDGNGDFETAVAMWLVVEPADVEVGHRMEERKEDLGGRDGRRLKSSQGIVLEMIAYELYVHGRHPWMRALSPIGAAAHSGGGGGGASRSWW